MNQREAPEQGWPGEDGDVCGCSGWISKQKRILRSPSDRLEEWLGVGVGFRFMRTVNR